VSNGLVFKKVVSHSAGNSAQFVEKRPAPERRHSRRQGQHQHAGQGEDLRRKGATTVPEDRIAQSFGERWSWDGSRHAPKATIPEEGIGQAAEGRSARAHCSAVIFIRKISSLTAQAVWFENHRVEQ